MKYLSISEARKLSGVRLVLSAHVPNPWCESAKALFKIRNVAYAPVAQKVMQRNEDLRAWTGVRNAPAAVLDDEPAVNTWLDILWLAERLGSGPSLLPDDPVARALALGFSTQICAPEGFGWQRRLTMFAQAGPDHRGVGQNMPEIFKAYGVRPEAVAQAPVKIVGILSGLAAQLRAQETRGMPYLVGDRVSACDIHWACFSQLVAPLAQDACPIPDALRATYLGMSSDVAAAIDPILIRHRDLIFARFIGLPLDF